MVSTRRTAQKELVIQPDPDAAMKKKPVRRTTAKQAEPETKSRTARAKKIATVEEEASETMASAHDTKTTAPGARTKPAARKVAEKPVKAPAAAPAATKTTKPVRSTRIIKKVEVSVDDAPKLAAPAAQQTVRKTRGAATNTQPLSPKKITQVSKPATRNARAASGKAAAKEISAQGPVRKPRTARRRAPSDENADVHVDVKSVPQQVDEDEEDEIRVVVRPRKNSRLAAIAKQEEDSEMVMSSRPTTPSDNGMPVLDDEKDVVAESAHEESEGEESTDESESDDELCGPKTPMKRSSPGAHAKYIASVQRTVQNFNSEVPEKTPARRFEMAGKTPVTQKLRTTALVPTSEARPLTVARGGDRAFVFRELRQPSLPEEQEDETSDHEDFTMFEGVDKSSATPSSPTQTDLLQGMSVDDVEDSILGYVPQQSADESLLIDPELEAKADESLLIDLELEARADQSLLTDLGLESAANDSKCEDDASSDDTVIVRESVGAREDSHAAQDDAASENEEDDAPETMIWENLRPDVTIQVDFDAHFDGASMLPQVESTEILNLAPERSTVSPETTRTREPTASAEKRTTECPSIESAPVLDLPASRRETLNMAGFINLNAMGEPSPIKPVRASASLPFKSSADTQDITVELPIAEIEADNDVEMSEDDNVDKEIEDDMRVQIVKEPSATEQDACINVQPVMEATSDFDEAILNEPFAAREQVALPDEVVEEVEVQAVEDMLPFGEERTFQRIELPSGASEIVDIEESRVQIKPRHNASQEGLRDATDDVNDVLEGTDIPHYALTTFAFDARRKSMPATSLQTPTKSRIRPNTSDGASMPRVRMPFQPFDFHQARATPVQQSSAGPDPVDTVPETPVMEPATPGERYPRLDPQNSYAAHAKTVMPARRFVTPVKTPLKRPASARKPNPEFATPRASELRPRATRMGETSYESDLRSPVAKRMATTSIATQEDDFMHDRKVNAPRAATPGERFPKLPARQDYEQLPQTVAAPRRFQTPLRSPAKRPSTAQKPATLRKQLALKTKTPIKTPLKAPAMTPGQIPMTPHPAAPLRGVTAMVEVFTMEGACASSTFIAVLQSLGAKTTKAWSDRVTHVVFKEGSPTTLQRIRLHNKEVAEGGAGRHIYCVNSRWVHDCETEGTHMDETAYECDLEEVPRGGHRRRKSMEPGVLQNIGGNVVRDRTSSWGKNSLRRSLAKLDSPRETTPQNDAHATPKAVITQLSDDEGSPATPDWLHPEKLIQQTAPLKRVRKLELEAKENRRMTGWDGVKF